MKHARMDYARIQDLAEVAQFLKAWLDENVPNFDHNPLMTALADRYGSLDVEPIPMDEPVFVLRAQDEVAPATVQFWADSVETDDIEAGRPANAEIVRCAYDQYRAMIRWQDAHGCQMPDMPGV